MGCCDIAVNKNVQDYEFSSQNPINSLYAPFTFLSGNKKVTKKINAS
jgi:hypothetical protein